jgi:signal transduction histidine kinase
MEPRRTRRPRRRGEPGRHTRVSTAIIVSLQLALEGNTRPDETADTRPQPHPDARLGAHLRRQQATLAADNRHLREVHRRQTAFVAQVAHELGTPLSARPPREWLDLAKRHAVRLAALTEDLLDLARLGAVRAGLNRRALDLVRLTEDVGRLLRPQFEAKGQRLTLERDPTLPVVSGDAARVTQILTNLLSNAYKYTPPGGRITVRVRGDASWVQVEVQDTGIGLRPEDQAQLFTPFFRARHRTVQAAGGTRLELALMRTLKSSSCICKTNCISNRRLPSREP